MKKLNSQHEMLAFIQPYGLEYTGGGSRILRSLLEASPYRYVSICCGPLPPTPVTFTQEIHMPVRPTIKRLEHSRFCKYLGAVLPITAAQYKHKLSSYLRSINVTGIHAIPQGIDFGYAFDVAQELEIPYYLNVHDELAYNLPNFVELPQCLKYLEKAWKGATERFVISEKMGEEYCRRYGDQKYLVITDGLKNIPKQPKPIVNNRFHIYFMGSVHISYEKNFVQLIHGLEQLKQLNPNLDITLIIRGNVSFRLPVTNLSIKLLGWGSQDEIIRDMEAVDFLYLPLPFEEKYDPFTRFSMSTKLVTYLGSALPILYHGPQYAAAADLLSKSKSAIIVDTLDAVQIAQIMLHEKTNSHQIVSSALNLAEGDFYLPEIQRRFWDSFSMSRTSDELVDSVI